MTQGTIQAKLAYGLDGAAIQDVIEIKPGESLLGADLEPLASSLDGWLSIANRSENSIYLHITKDSILLSLKDLSGQSDSDSIIPDESLTIPLQFSDSEETDTPSVSSTPLITSDSLLNSLENSLESPNEDSPITKVRRKRGTTTAKPMSS